MDQIIIMALSATTVIKVLIDILRMAWAAPQWAPPVLAVLGGPGIVVLLMVADAQILTQQAIAQAILAGILAAGSAVGVTELQKRTLPTG